MNTTNKSAKLGSSARSLATASVAAAPLLLAACAPPNHFDFAVDGVDMPVKRVEVYTPRKYNEVEVDTIQHDKSRYKVGVNLIQAKRAGSYPTGCADDLSTECAMVTVFDTETYDFYHASDSSTLGYVEVSELDERYTATYSGELTEYLTGASIFVDVSFDLEAGETLIPVERPE